jgi:hypothetical protein
MRRLLPLLSLLLLAASCSSDGGAKNPVIPPASNTRGTAVGPDHVFAHASPLVWSAVTNEVIGFSSPTPAAGTGLLAMRGSDGVVRVLDAATPLALALSSDGARVYYVADLAPASGDSMVLRRRALQGGAAELLGSAPDGTPISFVLSLDGDWLAWGRGGADPFDPGPLTLRRLSTGDTIEVGVGAPVAIAPDGSQLVYRPDPGSPALRLWSRATRTETSFDSELPIGAGPPAWRWDITGLRALYISGARSVVHFNHDLGTSVTVFNSPWDLDVQPPFWAPDGQHAAVWGRKPAASGNYTDRVLDVVDLGVPIGFPVASGSEDPGAVTFSADASLTAHLYGERLYQANAASTTAAAHVAR